MFDKYSIVCSLLNLDLGRVLILEEQERNWRSRDEIGGAETRLEEQEQDWRGLMFDKYSIVCSLLNWDLGRVMILEEQKRDWRSRDEIGGTGTRLEELRKR